jgi:hypothetical protein
MAKSPLNIRISGIEETFSKLNKNVEKIKSQVDNEMAAGVESMALNAKSIFSSDNTEIRASIRSEKVRDFSYQLVAGRGNDPMAAYIEFGTGKYFDQYPGKEKEWQDLARQYYVNGKGWMRPAQYFYPSVTSGIVSLESNIKQILNRDERL